MIGYFPFYRNKKKMSSKMWYLPCTFFSFPMRKYPNTQKLGLNRFST
tara:strand:- start:1 stop:141 length:141 start_codon:yes stop_codon:yes gene_type:complete